MTDPIANVDEGLDAELSWRLLRRSATLAGGDVAARAAFSELLGRPAVP
jgi:hypothetical protein